jgi:hypothetical protein
VPPRIGCHVCFDRAAWVAGTSPAMTVHGVSPHAVVDSSFFDRGTKNT